MRAPPRTPEPRAGISNLAWEKAPFKYRRDGAS
jgi:hypothetical protein